MTTGRLQNYHPAMLKCLPEAALLPKSIDSGCFTPSLEEVKAKRSQLSIAGEEDDHSSVIADGSFPRSTIDDILPPDHDSRDQVSPQLAAYLSSKFFAESRDAYADALRLGDTRGGVQALETGLGRLEKICRYDAGVAGIAGRIEVLGSLERPHEARALLYSLRAAIRQPLVERPRPTLQRGQSYIDPSVEVYRRERQDTLYEEDYRKAHMMLDAATWSEDRELAAQEAHRLQLDSTIFEQYRFRSPERRFERARDLLNIGLQHEHRGYAATDGARFQHLGKALNIYSQGCEETEIHHSYVEFPQARLTSHDHIDCSNLFFSASRICVYFHRHEHVILPADFSCIPPLTELDWARQALYFLERGKARALLRSIERYSEATVAEQRRVTLKDVAWEIRHMISSGEQKNTSRSWPTSDPASPLTLPESAIMERLRIRLAWRHTMMGAQSLVTGRVSRWWEAGLDEILQAIPDDVAIIEYGLVQGKNPGLLSFLITSTGVSPQWKGMRTTSILDNVAKLKDLIESAQTIPLDKRERRLGTQILDTVECLADELLSQFLPELLKKPKLFVVPSGALAHIPWALLLQCLDLPTPNHSLSLIPSLRIWYGLHKLSQSKPAASQEAQPPPATIICNSPRRPDGSSRDIKFSRIEALYLARRHETWPMLADLTTRETFERQCQQSTIIHLSSHGSFNEESPMHWNVDLFQEPLTALDLSRLAITARFVVFSSCLSAYSRVFDSGTALSFAHALLGGGACAFVGTLWMTGDVASLVFMVLFYKAMMVEGLAPSGALADTQFRMRNFTEVDKITLVDDLLTVFNQEAEKTSGLSTIKQESRDTNASDWMPHGRSQSTASGARAGKSAVNGSRSSSSSRGGVMSRVLGSLRRYSHHGGATANNKENTAWIDNYKITHHPDRPRHDKREGLKHRNSTYVMEQLNKMWQHNKKLLEEKKRRRGARERAVAAGFARSNIQGGGGRDYERYRQSDITRGNSEASYQSRLPSLHHDGMPNFSRKATLPDITQSGWQLNGRNHHGRSTHLPSSPSTVSDRMTIKVGLEMSGEEVVARSAGFRMTSEGIEPGGQQKYEHTTLPPLPPRSFRPSTVPPRPVSASIPSRAAPKGSIRKRHTRSLSRTPSQLTPTNTMQASSPRAKALRDTIGSLYINTNHQDSTPSLDLNSSPISERWSPLTPIEDVNVSDVRVGHRKPSSAKPPRRPRTCPMPLCGRTLVTTIDQEHNLCVECRSELQPRDSVFTTDVLNPLPRTYSPPYADVSTRKPLVLDDEYDSIAETNDATSFPVTLTSTRHSNGARKSGGGGGGVKRGSGAGLLQQGRSTRAAEEEAPSPKIIINNRHVISRFNKGRRGEFKLQAVPASRRHTHRKREQQHGHPRAERQTTRRTSARQSRDGNHDVNERNHIGFQLAGWQTPTSSAAATPRPPSLSPVGSLPPAGSRPRQQRPGPLLEPKTFSPAPRSARQTQNKDKPTAHHRRTSSDSRRHANGEESSGIGSGRRLSSLLGPPPTGKKAAIHKVHTPRSAPLPRSTRDSSSRRRSKHRQLNPDHLKQHRISEPASKGINMEGNKARSNLETEEKGVEDDIYREIDSIIDCYLKLPDTPDAVNKKRKDAAIASYYGAVPLDVEMKMKGFF
ncbi:CHAT domain-containing protein [Xylaria sp. FL1042]|nr:CHAT domain-containing protein [Xylaria sp. FL1042]